ncbi:hypothetical protein FRC11_002331 [Ceratobasidium sp. 423]|nr:hypothetical protein FRC11_002331 [Ceratobasidium sp. 423]
MGSYNILASSDNSCLGEAATVTAGQYSTLYSGGTATSTSSATPSSASSNGLPTSAVIGIAVAVPIAAIIFTALLLWLCYKQNHRQQGLEEKPEIDAGVSYPHTGYTPVPITAAHYTGSYYDVSTTGHYNVPIPIPYPLPPTLSDRNTLHTVGDASTSEPPSTASSEKRRHLVNPDAHSSGPIDAEPFDPSSISGTSGSRPRLPPLPPAYSAPSSRPAAASTDNPEPSQSGASSLTVGLAVGIAFLFLAILSVLLLFYLRRWRAGQRQPAPQFRPLQQPQLDEKHQAGDVRYFEYSVASAPLWTVDEEREDELSLSETQANRERNWSRTIRSILGRFTWLSQASDTQTGAKNEMPYMSQRQERPPPPPVSRVRMGRQPRR